MERVYTMIQRLQKEDIARFLRVIRKKNPSDDIILIWDARAHLSRLVQRTARLLNSILVFLPSYSPDLNPI
ncbi:MAG: transposase [Euryarchaeota archaeon]|nr:transposase [Euryarchaeota archaeon]